MHTSKVNYEQLRAHVQRGFRSCPLADCAAPIRRSRDIERDERLREQLQWVSNDVKTVWLKDGELRIESPDASTLPFAAATVPLAVDLTDDADEHAMTAAHRERRGRSARRPDNAYTKPASSIMSEKKPQV
jgi:hypothetical protein